MPVVIDPYRTGTAAAADMHLALRLGTNGALACAVLHVLFRDGLADRAYLAAYAYIRAWAMSGRTPQWAAAITGLSVAEIEAFAALYTAARRATSGAASGSRDRAMAPSTFTLSPACRPSLAHGSMNGGAFWMHAAIFNWSPDADRGPRRKSAGRARTRHRIGGTSRAIPTRCRGGPPVAAMLIRSAEPAASAPRSATARAGLLRDDLFVAVHELFMTDTAQLADIVLPATTFLEHDDIYGAGGHSHIQMGPAHMPPPGSAAPTTTC